MLRENNRNVIIKFELILRPDSIYFCNVPKLLVLTSSHVPKSYTLANDVPSSHLESKKYFDEPKLNCLISYNHIHECTFKKHRWDADAIEPSKSERLIGKHQYRTIPF